jgi:hypothetical protein
MKITKSQKKDSKRLKKSLPKRDKKTKKETPKPKLNRSFLTSGRNKVSEKMEP